MSCTIVVVAGPVRSGKTRLLVDRYRRSLAAGGPGTSMWLAPNHRAADAVRRQVVAGVPGGCFNPRVWTFDQFARRVLEASRLPVRPIGPLGQRQILKKLVVDALRAGEINYFAPIANTSGFVDLLAALVQELKRLEIWPDELRAARGSRASPKDRELLHLYEKYQQLLNEHNLYDAQGRFWSARAELRDGQIEPLAAVRQVFVDGFADFTRTEHEILQILAARADALFVSLPLEAGTARGELFAKPAATLAELESRHAKVQIERLDRTAAAWPALDQLERKLFAPPRQVAVPPDPAGIEIVEAAGVTNELELVARRAKALLVEGDRAAGGAPVRPGDILIVFRTLADDTSELVREVFTQFGIPVAVGRGDRLERSALARSLADWLRLDVEDWPARRLLALVVHNEFRPAWPEWEGGRAASAAEYVVRRLQIPSGREALLEQLDRLAVRGARAGADAEGGPRHLERQAALALPLLRRTAQLLDELPRRATLSAWADAIAQFAGESGLLAASDAADAAMSARDRQAWQLLVAALHESERLSRWLGDAPAELSLPEFLEQLEEILRAVPLPPQEDEAGRVRVLAAESARHVTAPYIFLAGLSERAFPPVEREDCLYGEAETRDLAAAGLPLVPRSQRHGHEMLLFYQLVTRATRRLVMSYPALDEAAQPLSPSPYLADVERAFAPSAIPRSRPAELSGVPASDEVFSPRDLRVRAAEGALEGHSELLARLVNLPATAPTARNLIVGLRAVTARAGSDAFGPMEGMLTSSAALRLLAQRFGPDHCWSPSQLEQYALCPHQFFLERVLGLDALADPVLAADYARRGQMLHSVLAAAHRALNRQAGRRVSPSELDERELTDRLAALADELLVEMRSNRPLADGLLEIDVRRMAAALAAYHQQHGRYDAGWVDWDEPLRPAHFEVAFGPRAAQTDEEAAAGLDAEDSLSDSQPFELDCGGQTIRFSGRIDRIDLGRIGGQTAFAIIDYKSGRSESAKASAVREGRALQLPLYALAAQKLLGAEQAIPAQIAYWHVAGKGCKESLDLHHLDGGQLQASEDWQALANQLPARVLALVGGIRQGQFPMASADDQCTSRCPFNTVCRVNQVRALGKTWQPPQEGGA